MIPRCDKRSDRVEIAPEALCQVTEEAEALSASIQRQTRVIGWYHSHPRITPYPSHIDLASQLTYQSMETAWVGLIFSVFYSDAARAGSMTMHCFRTGPGNSHEKIPVTTIPSASLFRTARPVADQIPALLASFSREISDARDALRTKVKAGGKKYVRDLVTAVADSQLYEYQQLVAVPALNLLRGYVLPSLAEEVARLEKLLGAA